MNSTIEPKTAVTRTPEEAKSDSTTSQADVIAAQLTGIALPHLKFLEEGAPLGIDDSLADAGLDSMASINLLIDIEDAMGLSIPDELIEENSFETIRTVSALVLAAKKS